VIGLDFALQITTAPVEKAAKQAGVKNVGHAAAIVRKDAIASIKPAEGASSPGSPPHTHGGKKKRGKGKLPKAILFAQVGDTAVVGPAKSITGTVGEAHEFGGKYKGETFAERPFMGPALTRQTPRFAESFAGSIGT